MALGQHSASDPVAKHLSFFPFGIQHLFSTIGTALAPLGGPLAFSFLACAAATAPAAVTGPSLSSAYFDLLPLSSAPGGPALQHPSLAQHPPDAAPVISLAG